MKFSRPCILLLSLFIFVNGPWSLFLFSCTGKKPAPKVEPLLAIKEMSELATVEYIVTKIIKARDNATWFKLGERNILMSCRATIKAGIDLSLITKENITIHDKSIDLLLPHAKIISLEIKPEDVKTEYETVTIFRSTFSSAERDLLAAQGEANIRAGIPATGILRTAEVNASLVFTNLLRRLGYETIYVHFDQSPAGKLP